MTWHCTEAFVALGAIDLNNLVDFYAQLLEQNPSPHQAGVYAEFRLPGIRLAIFLPKPDHQAEFAQTNRGCMSICLQVQNLEAVIKTLEAMAYPPGKIITASHGRELYSYDPEGNRLIFYEPKQTP